MVQEEQKDEKIEVDKRFLAYVIKHFAIGLVCLALAAVMAFVRINSTAGETSSATTTQRVFDTADYFTDSEEKEFAAKIADIAHRAKTDVVLYTTDEDVADSEVHPEMDAFQRKYGFGYGDDWAIVYFNLTTRYIYLTVDGRPAEIFDREGGSYDDVVQAIIDHRDDEDWYGGVSEALDVIDYKLMYGKYMPSLLIVTIAFVVAIAVSVTFRVAKETSNFARPRNAATR